MFSQSLFDKIHDRSILEIADKLHSRCTKNYGSPATNVIIRLEKHISSLEG